MTIGSMYWNGEKSGRVEWTEDMDDAIREAWPTLAKIDGVYSRTVKCRARHLGLRLEKEAVKSKREHGIMGSINRASYAAEVSEGDARRLQKAKELIFASESRSSYNTNEGRRVSALFTMEHDQNIINSWPNIELLKIPNRSRRQIYNRGLALGLSKAGAA